MTKFEYNSNNSGGDWWLNDEDWYNLEKSGWKVDWRSGRWLGALATSATKDFNSYEEAVKEFEDTTGQNYYATGCECCGRPHEISEL